MTQQLIVTRDVPAPPALGLRLDGSVALVNSRDVAERFGKRHDNVLRDIDVLMANSDGLAGADKDSSSDLRDVSFQQLGTWFRREQREAEFRAYQNKRRRLPGRQQTLFG